ncbi:hypothetical protein QG37_01049 [Candidozyma auris]|nr:hypothetical protein QG37_01049 [[Candida] auris]
MPHTAIFRPLSKLDEINATKNMYGAECDEAARSDMA